MDSEAAKTSPIRSHKLSEAPRTPTPFKRALADVYQLHGNFSNSVKKKYLLLFLPVFLPKLFCITSIFNDVFLQVKFCKCYFFISAASNPDKTC